MAGVEFSAGDIGAIFDQEIKMMISYCNAWMEDVFDGILENGEINP